MYSNINWNVSDSMNNTEANMGVLTLATNSIVGINVAYPTTQRLALPLVLGNIDN